MAYVNLGKGTHKTFYDAARRHWPSLQQGGADTLEGMTGNDGTGMSAEDRARQQIRAYDAGTRIDIIWRALDDVLGAGNYDHDRVAERVIASYHTAYQNQLSLSTMDAPRLMEPSFDQQVFDEILNEIWTGGVLSEPNKSLDNRDSGLTEQKYGPLATFGDHGIWTNPNENPQQTTPRASYPGPESPAPSVLRGPHTPIETVPVPQLRPAPYSPTLGRPESEPYTAVPHVEGAIKPFQGMPWAIQPLQQPQSTFYDRNVVDPVLSAGDPYVPSGLQGNSSSEPNTPAAIKYYRSRIRSACNVGNQ